MNEALAGDPSAGGTDGGAAGGPESLRAAGDRIAGLMAEIQAWPNQSAVAQAEEIVRAVTELYGAALEHVVDLVGSIEGDAGDELRRQFLADELVASLLVVHGLHPHDLSERVTDALDRTRPYLESHGGDVKLVEIDEDAGIAKLELMGSCQGCPSSTQTLRDAIEEAIAESAPEIVAIEDVTAHGDSGGADTSSPIALTKKPETAGAS